MRRPLQILPNCRMDSGYYVYTIQRSRQSVLLGLTGLGGSSLAAVAHRDLAATTSVVKVGDVRPTTEHVLHHETVVEAVRRTAPALPVRFGTIFPDEGTLQRALQTRYETLMDDLERLGDKVEMGLTVLARDVDVPSHEDGVLNQDAEAEADAGPGTRYMRARLSEHQREEARRDQGTGLMDSLETLLDGSIIGRRRAFAPASRIIVRAAYLLDPSSVSTFQATIDDLCRAGTDIRVLVSGPWPPYSFVTSASQGRESRDLLHDGVSDRLL